MSSVSPVLGPGPGAGVKSCPVGGASPGWHSQEKRAMSTNTQREQCWLEIHSDHSISHNHLQTGKLEIVLDKQG